MGKINPAKLANFLEIECFVLVACPENSLLDAKEFLCPIVTPYELEVALQPTQTWTGRYVLDFEQILKDHRDASDSASFLLVHIHLRRLRCVGRCIITREHGR